MFSFLNLIVEGLTIVYESTVATDEIIRSKVDALSEKIAKLLLTVGMMSVGAPHPIPEFVEHVTHPGFEFVRLHFALRWLGGGHVPETEPFG